MTRRRANRQARWRADRQARAQNVVRSRRSNMLRIMRRSTGVRDSPRDLSGNGGAGFLSRTRPPCHPDRTAWDLGLGNPGQTLLSIRRGTGVAANTELNWQQNRTRSVASFRPTQIENASKLATLQTWFVEPDGERMPSNQHHQPSRVCEEGGPTHCRNDFVGRLDRQGRGRMRLSEPTFPDVLHKSPPTRYNPTP